MFCTQPHVSSGWVYPRLNKGEMELANISRFSLKTELWGRNKTKPQSRSYKSILE